MDVASRGLEAGTIGACLRAIDQCATIQALYAELTDEGCHALAASKRKLWLVEESLAFRIGLQGEECDEA